MAPLRALSGFGRWIALLLLCLWPASAVWAGGPWVPRAMTAAEERAEKTREGWERKGIQAAPEMIAAVCKRDDLLASGAREVLIGLGRQRCRA